MTFPKEHGKKLHSTNPIERLQAEVKRRTVVGIFPNAPSHGSSALSFVERNDEWAARRYRRWNRSAERWFSITLPTVAV